MNAEDRRKRRALRNAAKDEKLSRQSTNAQDSGLSDDKFVELLRRNEDELLKFVAQINDVYQDKLKKDAPFMTFMLCGMQSAGKSTIMERFMNSVLNIVQEGTGTRCPLDTTCIHDANCVEPLCDLSGDELAQGKGGKDLNPKDVFERITEHNIKLGEEDRFSTKALRLVYRANNVQNMRFVDTPGIISTKGLGNDNREDIKEILRNEMGKPNTKLCVLLEPKEFATNSIVDFCDETFGDREAWLPSTTFLMTKFDKQLEDSRTGSKANKFLNAFHEIGCYPHLVITPTLAKEDLPPEELFQARLELIDSADKAERQRFSAWCDLHDRFFKENPNDELLRPETKAKIGFGSAKVAMRKIMLQDTVKRLPEVLAELRNELSSLAKEQRMLKERKRFSDPKEVKAIVGLIIYEIEKKILSYLDGDLESAMKFPQQLQTLEDEIDQEDSSDWTERELNHYTEAEDKWRDKIAEYEGEYPATIQPYEGFLGGKQVQRAIDFFRAVMIESLPDPFQLRGVVANATGFLGNGLQRENWERAMVQITRTTVKSVTHPGINYLIKHVGCILRRLFGLALEDVKQGESLSATFKLIPNSVEKHLLTEFDNMLWSLLQRSAEMTHLSLEPMRFETDEGKQKYAVKDGKYVAVNEREELEESWVESAKSRLKSLMSASGDKAKKYLKDEAANKSKTKMHFLPDDRTPMVTEEEKEKILTRSFEYIIALMDFNMFTLRFQLNHYLFIGFKESLARDFKTHLMNGAKWEDLIEPDSSLNLRLEETNKKIEGVRCSLLEVERLQRKM